MNLLLRFRSVKGQLDELSSVLLQANVTFEQFEEWCEKSRKLEKELSTLLDDASAEIHKKVEECEV